MSYGFYTANGPNANIIMNSDSIALLYAAEQYLAGNGSITAPGAAGKNVRVQASGVGYASPKFTYTQTDSGADRIVTITCSNDGYYRLSVDGAIRSNIGIQWMNNSSVLAISSSDFGYAYCGNATYVGSTQSEAYLQGIDYSNNPSTTWVTTSNAATYTRRYQIDTGSNANAPVCFVQSNGSGVFYNVMSVNVYSGTVWDIWVAGNSWPPTNPALQIKCFARLVGAGGAGCGIRLFDSGGKRTWDSTAGMLSIAQVVDFAAAAYRSGTGSMVPIQENIGTSVLNPYICAQGSAYISAQQTPKGSTNVTHTEWMNSYLVDGANVYRNSGAIPCTAYSDVGTLSLTYGTSLQAERYYLINGNLYP